MIRQFDLYIEEEDKWIRQSFTYQNRCVIALFEDNFIPPRESGKNVKINIHVVSQVYRPVPSDALGFIKVQIQGDYRTFFSLSSKEKKRQTLDWLFCGIEIVTQAYGWDIKPYEDARQAVLDLNFVNHWTWKKRAWWRNGRRLVAEVFVEHEVEEVRLYIQLRKRSGVILERSIVVTDKPNEFAFNKYFGALHWIDDHTVSLISKPWSDEPDKSVTFDQRHFPD